MSKRETLKLLDDCIEQLKHTTPEQIESMKERYNAMPPAECYRPPKGLEILLPTDGVDENGNTIYRTEIYEGE